MNAIFQRLTEYHQVQHRGQDRRGDGLRRHFPEAQDLFIQQGLKADHFSPSMIWMNTSSKSACCNCISSITAPASRNARKIGSTSG